MKRASSRIVADGPQRVKLDSGQEVEFERSEDPSPTATCPTPTESLAAALASCTVSTIQLYAERKEWDVTGVEAEVEMEYERYRPASFKLKLTFPDSLTHDQVERLRVIASKCPVHHALANPIPVEIEST